MEINNWRNEESRQKIVNNITDTLQRHMPQTGADGMNELKEIALRFEEKTYTVAISQQDYLQRISLKMLSLESKASGPSNHFHGSSPGNNQRPLVQQNNISSLQQNGMNSLQQNNINALQQHHQVLKQQEMMQAQAQQFKIHQQQHFQYQLLQQQQQHHLQQQQQQQHHHLQQQQQQLLQQQQFQQLQQQKQQQAAQLLAQLEAQQMPQLQQINELSNESKTKQSAVKQAFIQQHHPLSPIVTSLASQARGEARMIPSLDANSAHFNVDNEENAIKSKILAHPQYPSLLGAYIDCQKIGAPPEAVARLDALTREHQDPQRRTVSIGMDPELDQFMEAYCEILTKYHEELAKPFKEAMLFLKKIETQFNSLGKGTIRISSPADNDEKTEGGGSSEEVEDGSGDETDFQEVDHHAVEDRELKNHLLRKYSGYLSSLKQEFMKKKKKGKLPKDARQKLLDWWSLHDKWPYPSETEKIALAECTGLDQKQINNWFINQRKRHWKPSEDMHFMVMNSHSPHSAALYVERHMMTEGYL